MLVFSWFYVSLCIFRPKAQNPDELFFNSFNEYRLLMLVAINNSLPNCLQIQYLILSYHSKNYPNKDESTKQRNFKKLNG